MLWFVAAVAAVWFGGRAIGVPPAIRWLVIAIIWAAIVAATLILPEASRPVGATGEWLLVGGLAAVALGYARLLRWMRSRARPAVPTSKAPEPGGPFAPGELQRYARHIVLRELGGPGQKRLKEARVLVVGAGGLGSPALLYLAAAGVGTIGVIDDDVVSSSNLQRQVIHSDATVGMPKVFSAERAMKALNPFIAVRPYNRRLDEGSAADLIGEYDLVLDGCDNFETRYLVNRACHATGTALISGALAQWEGQISLFDPAHDAPCYQCIFPTAPAEGLAPSCAQAGVLGPLPGIIGAMMAAEAVKEIAGTGTGLRGRMLIYDALNAEVRTIRLHRRADCETCGEA